MPQHDSADGLSAKKWAEAPLCESEQQFRAGRAVKVAGPVRAAHDVIVKCLDGLASTA